MLWQSVFSNHLVLLFLQQRTYTSWPFRGTHIQFTTTHRVHHQRRILAFTNPGHVDEKLQNKGWEAWQVLGQLRAAENGVFKILQLLVEEGHKVVQLRPGGVLHTAVSGEKKIKSNWLLMGTHQVISTFQQEEYLLFISATICVFIFRTGQMLQDKHNMSMLLCHFSGQDKCCKTNITWICYSASTAKCSSQDLLLLLLSPLNQPKEILMERLTAKWLSQMDTYHQIYSIPR